MRRAIRFIALLSLCACSKPQPAPAEPAGAPPTPAYPTAAPVAEAVRPLPPGPAEALVRAFVDQWLSAQNDGRFDEYQGLYAKRLTGIRRSGARTVRLDRAGWMRDRAGMFKRKMLVEVADLRIEASTPSYVMVTFTQTWSSGNYRDVGPKELILVKESDALRISREELLRSDLRKDGVKPQPLQAGQWMSVEDRGGPRVILALNAREDWASGPPVLVSDQSPVVGRCAVNEANLPADLKAWKGRKVVLFGPGGVVCNATLGGLEIVGRFEPHFGTREFWNGADGQPKFKPAEIAAQALGTEGASVLAAAVVPDAGGSCRGALWARDAGLAAPDIFVREAATPDLVRLGQARFHAMRGYVEQQKDVGPDWEGRPEYTVFRHAATGRRYLSTWANVGGCGEPSASLWALWKIVDRNGRADLVLLTDERDPGGMFVPEAAADIDGDGQPEFIGSGGTVRAAGAVYVPAESIVVPNFDCPC